MVESGRVGSHGQKVCPMGLCWPQIGFKIWFNPIMYLINPNEPDLNPISGQVGSPGSKFGLSWVGLVRTTHNMEPLGIGCVKSLPERIRKYIKTFLMKIH